MPARVADAVGEAEIFAVAVTAPDLPTVADTVADKVAAFAAGAASSVPPITAAVAAATRPAQRAPRPLRRRPGVSVAAERAAGCAIIMSPFRLRRHGAGDN